jgi:hypothetical protein
VGANIWFSSIVLYLKEAGVRPHQRGQWVTDPRHLERILVRDIFDSPDGPHQIVLLDVYLQTTEELTSSVHKFTYALLSKLLRDLDPDEKDILLFRMLSVNNLQKEPRSNLFDTAQCMNFVSALSRFGNENNLAVGHYVPDAGVYDLDSEGRTGINYGKRFHLDGSFFDPLMVAV